MRLWADSGENIRIGWLRKGLHHEVRIRGIIVWAVAKVSLRGEVAGAAHRRRAARIGFGPPVWLH